MAGNVYVKGAKPSKHEASPLVNAGFDPAIKLLEKPDGYYLEMKADPAWETGEPRKLVTTELLGKAKVSGCAYENPDASPLRIDTDYFGKPRDAAKPAAGPFAAPGSAPFKVW